MRLVSVRDVAAILGQRHPTSLYKRIKEGAIKTYQREPNGPTMLNGDTIREDWARITKARADSTLAKERKQEAKPAAELADAAEEIPDYHESRARAEYEKATLLGMERKLKEGKLLDAKDATTTWARIAAEVRTKVLAIPSRARQRIPHLSLEEVEILMVLAREALEEVANGS